MQTHLFEDRVLKASQLRLGRDCVVGVAAVALYDSEMEDGARLDALSLLMKGETLPADTAWVGIPAAWRDGHAPDSITFDRSGTAGPAQQSKNLPPGRNGTRVCGPRPAGITQLCRMKTR